MTLPHPKITAAHDRYIRLMEESAKRGSRWGETRRFAGRSAGLRLERIERARQAWHRAIDRYGKWGEVYGDPETPAYITDTGLRAWMWRKGQRVRFFTADGAQVGPEHRNVAPAMCYAAAAGWIDPANPWLSVACTLEVRSQTKEKPCA